MEYVPYLDKGYVKHEDHMGSDLSFTRAARASFEKDSPIWNEREERLLSYLIRQKHFSVFRHGVITFQVKAPLMVARQHFKYVVASNHTEDQLGWNESSRRYVTEEPEFYVPNLDEWRGAPDNKKQGSKGYVDRNTGSQAQRCLELTIDEGMKDYRWAIAEGIAPEQARLFLPAYAMYIRYQWTTSVGALIHFLVERLDSHAQYEMRVLAQAVLEVTREYFPATIDALEDVLRSGNGSSD